MRILKRAAAVAAAVLAFVALALGILYLFLEGDGGARDRVLTAAVIAGIAALGIGSALGLVVAKNNLRLVKSLAREQGRATRSIEKIEQRLGDLIREARSDSRFANDIRKLIGELAESLAIEFDRTREASRSRDAAILEDVRSRLADSRDQTLEAFQRHSLTSRSDHAHALNELEAWDNIREMLQGHPRVPEFRGWAVSSELGAFLMRSTIEREPDLVVELGSGSSTVLFAAALRASGRGKVIAIEHDERFADTTRRHLDRWGLQDWADIIHAPLGPVTVDDAEFSWYQIPDRVLDQPIDFLFVDGPPGSSSPLARYPAMPLLEPRMSDHAMVVLDDASRPDEREVVARWSVEFPGFDQATLGFRPEVAVFTRQ